MSGFTLASGQLSTTVSVVCPVCAQRRELTPAEAAEAACGGVLSFYWPFCSLAHANDPDFLGRLRCHIAARRAGLESCTPPSRAELVPERA